MNALKLLKGKDTVITGKRKDKNRKKTVYRPGDIIPFDEKKVKDGVRYKLVDADSIPGREQDESEDEKTGKSSKIVRGKAA